jgi:hypothetical protein
MGTRGSSSDRTGRRRTIMQSLRILLTEPQYEVLEEITRASGDTIEEYLQSRVLAMMRSDIDEYFGFRHKYREELKKKLRSEIR